MNSLKYYVNSDKLLNLSLREVKARYQFDFLGDLLAREKLLAESELKSEEDKIWVMHGADFDLHKVGLLKHVPNNNDFIIFEYKGKNRTRDVIRKMLCTHKGCKKVIRKWHSLFDHLRIHSNERPYACTEPGCEMRFNQ